MGHGHETHEQTADPHQSLAEASEANVMLAFCAALAVAVGGFLLGKAPGQQPEAPVAVEQVSRPASAAVATAAPEASDAAVAVLAKGGNAFDALVAASFVVSVVRPEATGIGGGGFVVFHDASRGVQGVLDGREAAPAAATPDMFVDELGRVREGYEIGPLSAGVPGLVALLEEVHQRHGSGRVSWRELVEPAIRYAEDGFVVPAALARAIATHRATLERYPSSAEVFLPEGRAPQAGEVLRQPALAATLRKIAERGADGFYRGQVAETLARAARRHGGILSAADLRNYEVKEREAIRGAYRGRTIVSMPPPSSGGVHLVQMLNVLSGYDLAGLGFHSPTHLHLLAETMRLAFADRSRYMADADFVPVPVEQLTDPAYAARLRGAIDLARAGVSRADDGGRLLPERPHTTHISIVDAEGNAVASTQTINTSLGSCFVAGDTGVVLNNEMADFTADPDQPNPFGLRQGEQNLPEARKRPLSSMTPTLVFDSRGRVEAVVGSPGGPTIITTVLQVVSNLVDFGMSAGEAVAAPRLHHQWLPDEIVLEAGLKNRAAALARLGHQVRTLEAGAGLGNAQVVVVTPSGAVGASDPRGTGRPASLGAAAARPAAAAAAAHDAQEGHDAH